MIRLDQFAYIRKDLLNYKTLARQGLSLSFLSVFLIIFLTRPISLPISDSHWEMDNSTYP